MKGLQKDTHTHTHTFLCLWGDRQVQLKDSIKGSMKGLKNATHTHTPPTCFSCLRWHVSDDNIQVKRLILWKALLKDWKMTHTHTHTHVFMRLRWHVSDDDIHWKGSIKGIYSRTEKCHPHIHRGRGGPWWRVAPAVFLSGFNWGSGLLFYLFWLIKIKLRERERVWPQTCFYVFEVTCKW
jgi:hypothetical protein